MGALPWDSRTQFPPYDGQLRLNAYSHVASGANMVACWHWHSLHYGQETYWKGLLSHDLEPNRLYREATRIAQEFKKLDPRLVGFTQDNGVAILYSGDSLHGIQFMPFDDGVNYITVPNQFYGALYRLNIGVDFLFQESDNFAGYKVILVPPLYVAYGAGENNKVSVWAKFLIPETVRTLATYDHPFFGNYPALTRNRHGKETLTYQGTFLSNELQAKVLAEVVELAGLMGPGQKLPPPVRVKHGANNAGNPMRYYMNYSAQAQTFVYPYKDGRDLLTGKDVEQSGSVTLAPWDLVIIEELK